MKILKYAGITVVALVISFFGLGLFVPSFDYASVVTVNASPENCWAALQDSSRMKNVMPGLVRITLKRGEHLKAGAEYEIVIRQDKIYIMQETLKEVRPPEWAAYELTNDVMTSVYHYQLIPKSSQTEIHNLYQVTGNNLVWKSILFLSKSYLQQASQLQLDMLKKEIESE